MLNRAIVFLIVAFIAGVLGFTSLYITVAGIAKIVFVIFLELFVVSSITSGLAPRNKLMARPR